MYQDHKDHGRETTVSRGGGSLTPWTAMNALHNFRNRVDTLNGCIEIVIIRDNAISIHLWCPGDSLEDILAGLYHNWDCPPGPEIRNGDVIEIRLKPYVSRTPSPPKLNPHDPHSQTPPRHARKHPREPLPWHTHFETMCVCLQSMPPVQV